MDLNDLKNAAQQDPKANAAQKPAKLRRKGKPPHEHPTKAQVDARIQIVYKLLLKGYDSEEIVEYCGKEPSETKTWQVKKSAAYKYIERAQQRLWADFQKDTSSLRNQAARMIMEAYKLACTARDQRGMLSATNALIDLYGVAMKEPLEVHHTGAITLQAADEARERLKLKATRMPALPAAPNTADA